MIFTSFSLADHDALIAHVNWLNGDGAAVSLTAILPDSGIEVEVRRDGTISAVQS